MAALIVINNIFSRKAGFYKKDNMKTGDSSISEQTPKSPPSEARFLWDGTKQRPATAINLHSSVRQCSVE